MIKTITSIEPFKDSKSIRSALQSRGWAILTATREAVGPWNCDENKKANWWAVQVLTGLGYEFEHLRGTYKGVNQGPSFLVVGMSTKAALDFARYFGQESVLVPAGLLYITRKLTPVLPSETVVGRKAEAQECFSQVLPHGPTFSLGLDFSQTIEL